MFHKKVVQKIKIHILYSVTFPENRAVYEITSKNVVQRKRPQMAKLRRVACWISKTTRALAYASIREHTHTHTQTHRNMQDLLLFHCSNDFGKATQCYV
jgi:hypothetical protein